MHVATLSVNFKGQYKELYSTEIPSEIKCRPRRLKPYLKQVAKHLPEGDALMLSYCSEGLRVGHKSVKKFKENSIMESDVSLKFSKPISQKEMLKNHTSEYVLKVLPVILGKENFEKINDKIHAEIDFPTPYHEFKFMQENYPDEEF